MVADQSSVAKEALQQLHGLLVSASAADNFKPGDEAIILTNLMRLVQETAAHSSTGKRRASCVCVLVVKGLGSGFVTLSNSSTCLKCDRGLPCVKTDYMHLVFCLSVLLLLPSSVSSRCMLWHFAALLD